MRESRFHLIVFALTAFLSSQLFAEELPPVPREQWGAPAVTVLHVRGNWIISGKKHKVILNDSDFSIQVEADKVTWATAPSAQDDMLVKSKGEEFYLRLADADKIDIAPYDSGYKTGVKMRLEQFRHNGLFNKGRELDLALCLTVCLEGTAEDLVCEVTSIERESSVRQLDWPKELDASDVDYTVLNHVRGNLLPRNWPEEYHPYRNVPRGQESLHHPEQSHRVLVDVTVGISKRRISNDPHRGNVRRCGIHISSPGWRSDGSRSSLAGLARPTSLSALCTHVLLPEGQLLDLVQAV